MGHVEDDQLSMDLGVTAEQTAWGTWADPERRKAQVRKLLVRAELPAALPVEPWDFESDEAAQLSETIAELFPDLDAVRRPENADTVDQLVCLIGELFVQYLDARWLDLTGMPAGYNDCDDLTIYDEIKPGIAFTFANWTTCTADLLVCFVVENEFVNIVELVHVGFWRLHKDDVPSFAEIGTGYFSEHPPFRE
ncbi:hypothetical protein [Nocardia brasiliensis]|uniref:hypothetical protein n=1 Tax=Nocardia brasiliensis TaxID=37326 RepID=UPI00245412A8|nr:hypothetical protein [Nocardia brasiliensis]